VKNSWRFSYFLSIGASGKLSEKAFSKKAPGWIYVMRAIKPIE